VLQDLQNIVELLDLGMHDKVIKMQAYCTGYLRWEAERDIITSKSIMHNLPQDEAVEMLRIPAVAMGQYSRLAIFDRFPLTSTFSESPKIVPSSSMVAQDVSTMGLLSSRERSQEHDQRILEEARFEISRTHEPKTAEDSEMIQCSHYEDIVRRLAQRVEASQRHPIYARN